MKLIAIILNQITGVSKPQKKFLIDLIATIIGAYGKINFRSLARLSGLSEKTFRRWFRKPFAFAEFNSIAIDTVIKQGSELIAAFDQSFISKAGKKTWGLSYFWNGCNSRAEKGLEYVLCVIVDTVRHTPFTLGATQTPPIEETNDKKESIDDDYTRIDFYLSFVRELQSKIMKYTKYIAFDGYFTKKKFVDGIVEMGFYFIGKLRIDANLKIPYTGKQKRRGRPRKFAGKSTIEKLEGFSFVQKIDDAIEIYAGTLYHASLEKFIKVIAVRYFIKGNIGTALLFSTDLELDPLKVYSYYKARFQIEFVFRDGKQHLGLGDCQSLDKEAQNFHLNAIFAAYNVVKIEDILEQGNDEERRSFSMASHKTRYHNKGLIDRFFPKLVPELNLIKSPDILREIINYGAIVFR
jgi:hypothetical protein